MKTLMLITTLLLTGCISNGAGESAYTVKPIKTNDGKVICCDVNVNNTKDYDKLDMKFTIGADGTIEFQLKEDGVNASDPAAVAAQNNAKLIDTVSKLVPVSTGN